MADYETFPVYLGDLDTVAIPQFQRGYVWNSTKKNALIETLHNGFPFGSLLTYQGQNGQERLLDGQQRLSTIRDFRKRPLHYWKQIALMLDLRTDFSLPCKLIAEEHFLYDSIFTRI